MISNGAYLRFPTIRQDLVAFVAEDDVWLAGRTGGRAWRLTADRVPVADTRLSPDGSAVAFTSRRDGDPEVHVVDADGGPARRLSYWGDEYTRVIGWTADGRVLAVTAAGEPFRSRTWAYAVPLDGGPSERLPYGPVSGVAAGPDGMTVLGVNQHRRSAAAWKRYRGGMAGALWIDRDTSGQFVRFAADLDGQLEDPGWVGDRVVFLSDHQGWGNVYSRRADGTDPRRHTDHGDAYTRAAHTDGQRVIYQCLGELWLLDDLSADSEPHRLDIRLAGPRTARARRPVDAAIGEVRPDHAGRASAVEVRGTVQWLAHRDGPARVLADVSGVRHRMPRVLGTAEPHRVAWVTDADGDDAIEIGTAGVPGAPRRLAGGQLGRVLDLAAAPDGSALAVASHDGRVLVVEVDSGRVHQVDSSEHSDPSGLAFSPDSRWLAWSHPGPNPLRQIRLARVDTLDFGSAEVIHATALRFVDTEPAFTLDGKFLAFLSARTFDPVYDQHVFDMSFLAGVRPQLLPLAATTPSPFDPEPGGRPVPRPDSPGDGPADGGSDGSAAVPEVTVDVEGLHQRAVPVPVPAGPLFGLQVARDGLLWLRAPLTGVLGDARAPDGSDHPRSRLERYDLRRRRSLTLVETADSAAVTGDGRSVVVADGQGLRMVPADHAVESSQDTDESTVDIDTDRLRVWVDPAAEWRQMFDEAGRLMRDHFWIADMAGVDWDGVLDRYRPVLDRVGSRDDLSELFWEVQGELGSSHAYESPPGRVVHQLRRLGHLGADLVRDADGTWRVGRVVPGEPSAPAARSPLLAPGVAVRSGDVIVAVDGRPTDPLAGPAALLAGAAGTPVELTVRRDRADGATDAATEGDVEDDGAAGDGVEGAGGDGAGGDGAAAGGERRVVVEPLPDERALRYQDWVAGRRAAVHAATDGRVGYLHIPDMMAEGWAQLHRDLHLEVAREALVVDVRDNNGGHTSSLVLEKLSRTVQGWDIVRHGSPNVYPENTPRGPLVALANENAGSDGDIVTAVFQQLGLGPVVGTRTWGGVIGIDGRYRLVDGTSVTQPRYSFWFNDAGWNVENRGVDPDVEVPIAPQDWAAGADPQLDTAVRLALAALETRPAATPPDPATRPSRIPPTLPPRPAAS
ncbi:MAG TPA: S41 family peptidase [Mycobacteriales bacterium]|nr:S41 family peptidase [Mycobacteriales bacterium]